MCGIVETPLQLDDKVPNSKGLGSACGRSQWEEEFRLRQWAATLQRAVRRLLEHLLPGQRLGSRQETCQYTPSKEFENGEAGAGASSRLPNQSQV